ncbi:MAG: hypothetical protein V3T70_08005, partial [Phycisphaerae bacterium]
SICYRPTFIGGASSAAAMRRMIDWYGGTMIGDEQDSRGDSDLTATWVKMLNQGFQRGRPLIFCDTSGDSPRPQKFDIYGPKVLASRRPFDDEALESRCLTVPIEQRTRDDIPKNLPRSQFDAEALSLRNQLTLWRFHHWHDAKLDPTLAVADVDDRLNQIATPLLSVISDADARRTVIAMLRGLQCDMAEKRADTYAGWIVQYLDEQWDHPEARVAVGDVAKHVNGRLAADQDVDVDKLHRPVTPQRAGKIIRDELGLKTTRKGGTYHVRFDRRKLDRLLQRYMGSANPVTSPASQSCTKSCAQPIEKPGGWDSEDSQDLLQDSSEDTQDIREGGVPDGWTKEHWRTRLHTLADGCEAVNPVLAEKHRADAAALVECPREKRNEG